MNTNIIFVDVPSIWKGKNVGSFSNVPASVSFPVSAQKLYSIFLYFFLRLGSMLIQLDAIVSVNSESSTLNQFRNIQGFYGNYLHAAHDNVMFPTF